MRLPGVGVLVAQKLLSVKVVLVVLVPQHGNPTTTAMPVPFTSPTFLAFSEDDVK